jgi:hypothetical protein
MANWRLRAVKYGCSFIRKRLYYHKKERSAREVNHEDESAIFLATGSKYSGRESSYDRKNREGIEKVS